MEEFWGEIPLGKEEKGVAEEKKQGIFGTLKLLAGTGVLEFTGSLMARTAPSSKVEEKHQDRVNRLSGLPLL